MFSIFTNLFTQPTPEQIVKRDLEDARHNLLVAQAKRDYYDAMVDFSQRVINRLAPTDAPPKAAKIKSA